MVAAQILRNFYILEGIRVTLKLRRTLVSALFDKVTKLSVKSMASTNSGKLISLISADLFLIEKGLSVFPILFAAPFINLTGGYLLSQIIGLWYTLMVFVFWFGNMGLQFCASKVLKRLKAQESLVNDERLQLINDLVVGCRTIKCYAWEKHYTDKIDLLRSKQMSLVTKVNII